MNKTKLVCTIQEFQSKRNFQSNRFKIPTSSLQWRQPHPELVSLLKNGCQQPTSFCFLIHKHRDSVPVCPLIMPYGDCDDPPEVRGLGHWPMLTGRACEPPVPGATSVTASF